MGLLEGKVALITGAGGGLGRAYALLFAKEGCKVVVNDLGGSRDGSIDGNSLMADQVVAEIREAGGEAVANYASVSDPDGAQSIVDSALNEWGRLDICVNNAGILRDKTLLKMEPESFNLVMDVHVKGTFLVGRAAATAMRKCENGGAIINTSSIAGLKGNFGQTNYGCAKAGIYGMTMIWSQELTRYGVRTNAIAPMAKTRMTEDISAVPDEVTPEQIAPMVLFLASDLAKEVNGRTFGVHGKHLFEYHMMLSPGVEKSDGLWTASEIQERLDAIGALPSSGSGAESSAASRSPAEKAAALMLVMPQAFKADKAVGWDATLHFLVGEQQFTLAVADGSCTASEGLEGTATSRIEIDSTETILGMAAGSMSPQLAFMSGKIKTDNMGDLVRFSQSFSMRRAKELAGEVLESGGTAEGADPIQEAFTRMPDFFLAEKAGSWSASIHFNIPGAGSWSVDVKDGECTSKQGKPEQPTCTITYESGDVFIGTISGSMQPEQAFLSGKIKADNMGDLMRFAQCFDMKRAQQEAQAHTDGTPAAESAVGMNRDLIGKTYRGSADFIRPAELSAFAKATNDDNPQYLSDSDSVAPLLYPVVPCLQMAGESVVDPQLNADLLRLLHGEQDMRFYDVLRPWDLVAARATIEGIEDKSSGQLLSVRQHLMRDGEVVCDISSSFFVRNGSSGSGKGSGSSSSIKPTGNPLFESSYGIDGDQSHRYAAVSQDNNPIHVDDDTAKAAGHRGVILHGLCTMVMAGREVINHLCGGDPRRLKRLKVRFTQVVYPGDTLTTRAWALEKNEGITTVALETVNQNGETVIGNALAEFD